MGRQPALGDDLDLTVDPDDRRGVVDPVRRDIETGKPPLRVGGRWIPEQIRRAGGWDLLGREGRPAEPIDWEAVLEVDPEALVLAPAGGGLREVLRDRDFIAVMALLTGALGLVERNRLKVA